MAHSPRPADTSPEAHLMLVERWRSMTIADRSALIEQLCRDIDRMARAGVVAREPALTEIEISRELTRRRYGAALADAAYANVHPHE